MPVTRAIKAYKEERLNCAQSVLRAFQQQRSISEDDIEEARWHGGGRAKDGMCGALHSALKLTPDTSARDCLRSVFVERAGAETCRDIRHGVRTPCIECVRIATSLLVELECAPERAASRGGDMVVLERNGEAGP